MRTFYSLEHDMSSIPHIKKSDVAHWTDNVYFQRGQKYYEQGAIYEQRIQGMTIKSNIPPLFQMGALANF